MEEVVTPVAMETKSTPDPDEMDENVVNYYTIDWDIFTGKIFHL